MEDDEVNTLIPQFAHALDLLKDRPAKPLEITRTMPEKKKAAVAVVIRVHPSPSHPPPTIAHLPSTLNDFFSRPWVRHGTPEMLFIKRATRKGDRWNGHVAFPGGRYDDGDSWSKGTAMRECLEEVGLDLTGENVIYAGEIKERRVQTMWSSRPLMILAAQVFVLLSPIPPSLKLEKSEVASAHWVPLKTLLDRRNYTSLYCDIVDRLHIPLGEFTKQMLRGMLGQMRLPAVKMEWGERSVKADVQDDKEELVLWGLTLGIALDVLAGIPYAGREMVENVLEWPTMTARDLDFWVRGWTGRLRRERLRELREDEYRGESVTVQYAEGYFDQLRTALYLGLGVRAGALLLVGTLVYRRIAR